MTDNEKEQITQLQQNGWGYKKIAVTLGLPVNSVKTHCRRHPVEKKSETAIGCICQQCGTPITANAHCKAKKFCSDKCRMAWWNAHPNQIKRKAFYSFTCAYCGREFKSYGNAHRVYCSRECYASARRKEADSNG